jgi:UDP:flavonoid glycosyltransferase YjiC (YdhE family)
MPADIKNKVRELLINPVFKVNADRIQADFMKYNAPENASALLERIITTSEGTTR